MSDIVALRHSLELILEAANRAIRAQGSGEIQEAFCLLIHRQLPTIAADYEPGAGDSLRLKIVSSIETTLRTLASARPTSADDRARLVVSYARSLRADIDKLLRTI